jgi:hypothetical protein
MKILQLRYVTVFIILLFSLQISKGQESLDNKEFGVIILNQGSENGSTENNCLNLELKESKSRPTNQGEKVETIVITCSVSKYSEVRLLNLLTLQKLVLLKKNYSLISHCYLLISKTLHISTLVNILRI